MNDMVINDKYEVEAVRQVLDAVTSGMAWIVSEGRGPDDAAIVRLQKVLTALGSIYPDELLDSLSNELINYLSAETN